MTNLEKHREEFAEAMDRMRIREWSELFEISGLEFEQFKESSECSNAFIDWLLEETKVDWSQVEPGTKCLVRDNENDPWVVREFAVFAFGKPWFFSGGSSIDNMTNTTCLYTYNYCKLKEDED